MALGDIISTFAALRETLSLAFASILSGECFCAAQNRQHKHSPGRLVAAERRAPIDRSSMEQNPTTLHDRFRGIFPSHFRILCRRRWLGLIGRADIFKERMCQRLLHGNPLRRVGDNHLLQQIEKEPALLALAARPFLTLFPSFVSVGAVAV